MSRYHLPVLGVLVLGLAAVGLGCSHPSARTPAPGSPTATANPQPLLFPPAATSTASARDQLVQALNNFSKVNSFRAEYTISNGGQGVTGDFHFMKPDRFSGVITANSTSTQLIVVGSSVYVNLDGVHWQDLTGTASGKQLVQGIQSDLISNQAVDPNAIPADADVTESYDATQKCNLYTTQVKDAAGNADQVRICVANGVLQGATFSSGTTTIQVTYPEINKIYSIQKPISG